MSASKIKNLILLILLLGVLGLLPAVVPTQAARTGAERNVHEKLEELYSSYGLTLDASSLPDSQTLYAIELAKIPFVPGIRPPGSICRSRAWCGLCTRRGHGPPTGGRSRCPPQAG